MDNRSIGIFDSGLGGLTVMKEVMRTFPKENIIYFGDTGRVPYGTKSRETIIKYSNQDVAFLVDNDVKYIIIACGTASSVALSDVRKNFKTPVIGVVDATAEAAIKASRNGKIGIIATSGTIKSGAYESIIKKAGFETFSKACPLFVPLVENGHFETEVARLVVAEYLTELKDEGIDTLILGCTHYPHLKKVIGEFMGENVTLIDPGVEVSKYLKTQFNEEFLNGDYEKQSEYQYYVSDGVEGFEELASTFLEKNINGKVKKIDIEKY